MILFDNKYSIMINEIYINDELVKTDNPRKKFKKGFKIRCTSCKKLIERKWYDKKILEVKYECWNCVMEYRNPMHDDDVKRKHDSIVKSVEYRENMRKATLGEKNGFYGKKHSKKTKELIIRANKDYWDSMTEEERRIKSIQASNRERMKMEKDPIGYRKAHAKAARASHKSQFDNKKMNNIETEVYDYIVGKGVDVKYSVILASYQFDFGIKDKKILIEVDGNYWHGNPKFYNKDGTNGKRKLNDIQLRKIERDKEKEEWAISRGFILIRLWEDEINNETFKNKLNGYI